MTHRNLVISPCGNHSEYFRTHWIKDSAAKQFDLCLLFYHDQIDEPALYAGADYFIHRKGFKYRLIHDVLTQLKPEFLEQYDYFFFPDDDVAMQTEEINRLFLLCRAFDTWIAQPALTADSYHSWAILKQQPGCFLRYMGQVESMAPLFQRRALLTCLPSFVANLSGWGCDSVWSKLLNYPAKKLVVFDCVPMHHTRPVGSGELYRNIGVDPFTEWRETIAAYGALPENFVEQGRLLQVDAVHNRFYFLLERLPEKIRSRLAAIRRKGYGKAVKKFFLQKK